MIKNRFKIRQKRKRGKIRVLRRRKEINLGIQITETNNRQM